MISIFRNGNFKERLEIGECLEKRVLWDLKRLRLGTIEQLKSAIINHSRESSHGVEEYVSPPENEDMFSAGHDFSDAFAEQVADEEYQGADEEETNNAVLDTLVSVFEEKDDASDGTHSHCKKRKIECDKEEELTILLDVFHAIQRISRTLKKGHVRFLYLNHVFVDIII